WGASRQSRCLAFHTKSTNAAVTDVITGVLLQVPTASRRASLGNYDIETSVVPALLIIDSRKGNEGMPTPTIPPHQ
ncbi:hypothetical protein P9395_24730, partial [Escherichia coli]